MTTVLVDDVRDELRGRTDKSDTTIQNMIDRAERASDTLFSTRVGREGQIEGDEDDFILYLACHFVVVADGGDVQNESQTGGSVSYDHLQGNVESALTETRYGRLAKMYLRDGASIGVEIT